MAFSTTSSRMSKLLFRQLFEKESSTYTYLLADVSHPDKPALLIDPVDRTVDRDLSLVKDLGLKLIYAMNTHVHADHITGTGLIKTKVPGVKSIISKASNSKADILVESGEKIHFGDLFLEAGRDVSGSSFLIYSILNFTKNSYSLSVVSKDDLYPSISTTRKEQIKFYWDFVCKEIIYPHGGILKVYLCGLFGIRTVAFLVRATPGHTVGCVTYVTGDGPDQPQPRMAFTGDAVLIRGCGRTDFQGGSSENLYKSVHSQVFTLPKDTFIYPAHDYKGFTVTTVGEEMLYNPRLCKDEETFKGIMANLNLAYPKMIDIAVPANMVCGLQDPVPNKAS